MANQYSSIADKQLICGEKNSVWRRERERERVLASKN